LQANPARRVRLWRRGDLTVSAVRRLLDSAAGVLRTGAALESALGRLQRGAVSPAAADTAEVAAMICSAALKRPQSVGSHQRLDAPTLIAV
jgi:L-aspartate oxidase